MKENFCSVYPKIHSKIPSSINLQDVKTSLHPNLETQQLQALMPILQILLQFLSVSRYVALSRVKHIVKFYEV